MAAMNPTGEYEVVPLDLPDPQVESIRETVTICLLGVLGDLNTPDEAVDPIKSRREANAYERLLTGLDCGGLVLPDEAAREAIEAMAIAADKEDNYAEILARHDALFGLLDRLGGVKVEEC